MRAAWTHATLDMVRTICIDPASALILWDVNGERGRKYGMRSIKTTTFNDYESNPTFASNIFRFSIPLSAVEAKLRD